MVDSHGDSAKKNENRPTRLPILLSVPHSGLLIPEELQVRCVLTKRQIERDGDEGAAVIYDLADFVARFESAQVARAFVDLNREETDRRPDGIVKTETCWQEVIYDRPLEEPLIERLLEKYYRPYHQTIDDVDDSAIRLCVDCHTMAAEAPPIGPDPGRVRPQVCLGDNLGETMPTGWMDQMAECFAAEFGPENVAVNDPFKGGYITRFHGRNRPWVQLELSRAPFLADDEKRRRVLSALTEFCRRIFG